MSGRVYLPAGTAFKSGGSVALRIPSWAVKKLGLRTGETVELGVNGNRLFIRKKKMACAS